MADAEALRCRRPLQLRLRRRGRAAGRDQRAGRCESRASKAHLAVDAKWLVCREECIPGKATLTLDLPDRDEGQPPKPDGRWTMQFARARLAQPQATAWKGDDARSTAIASSVTLRGPGLPDRRRPRCIRRSSASSSTTSRRRSDRDGDALIVDFGKSEYFGTPPETFDLVIDAAVRRRRARLARAGSIRRDRGALTTEIMKWRSP